MVPLSAASMEKGKLLAVPLRDFRPYDGGSTRRYGELEDVRRLESMPTRLCFGEPREAEMGVTLEVFGAESESADGRLIAADGVLLGVEVKATGLLGEKASVKVNLETLPGVPSKALERFDGDEKMAGSMFSESWSSSKEEGAKRFLAEARPGFSGEVRLALEGEESEAVMAGSISK